MWDDWRLNIFRGIKENRLKMEANKIARRKCWETGAKYEECCNSGGLFGHRHCRGEFQEFLNCSYHEREVELDKLRRDMTRHTEWYWRNIYDEDGEIGKQAEWQPEEGVTSMWKQMAYGIFNKPKIKADEEESSKAQQLARLKELRNQQGSDVEYYKDELFQELTVDKQKSMEINGQIDFKIYNV